ncbi:MAG: sulfur globule protein CV1, partial [Candidatus Sedimenticola endophacoides]
MRKMTKMIGVAAIAGAAALAMQPAQAWWGGPWGGGPWGGGPWGNNGWGDGWGDGFGDFNMN